MNVAANATATITTSANNVALDSTQTYTATINGNATLGTPAGTVVFTIVSATTNTSGSAARDRDVQRDHADARLEQHGDRDLDQPGPQPPPAATSSPSPTPRPGDQLRTAPSPSTPPAPPTASPSIETVQAGVHAGQPGRRAARRRHRQPRQRGLPRLPRRIHDRAATLVQSIALPNARRRHAPTPCSSAGRTAPRACSTARPTATFLTAQRLRPAGRPHVRHLDLPLPVPAHHRGDRPGRHVNTSTAIGFERTGVPASHHGGQRERHDGHHHDLGRAQFPGRPERRHRGDHADGLRRLGHHHRLGRRHDTSPTRPPPGWATATLNSADGHAGQRPVQPARRGFQRRQRILARQQPAHRRHDRQRHRVRGQPRRDQRRRRSGRPAATPPPSRSPAAQLYVTKGSGNVQAVGTRPADDARARP